MFAGSAKYGATQFADLSVDEFKAIYRNAHFYKGIVPERMAEIPDGEIPVNVDWRAKGGVTPVKNQGKKVIEKFG